MNFFDMKTIYLHIIYRWKNHPQRNGECQHDHKKEWHNSQEPFDKLSKQQVKCLGFKKIINYLSTKKLTQNVYLIYLHQNPDVNSPINVFVHQFK